MTSKTVFLLFFVCTNLFSLSACSEKPGSPAITVTPDGKMTAFGAPAETFEALKALLVDSISNMQEVPGHLEIAFEGEVGMGMRQEVQTIVAESIEAARLAKLAPTVEMKTYVRKHGTDCNLPDSVRVFCAVVDLEYPVLTNGNKGLIAKVNKWREDFLLGLLEGGLEGSGKSKTLDEGAEAYFDIHDSYKDSPMGGAFEASTRSEVVLNDGRFLTLGINGYSYTGGAHGNHYQLLGTFDVKSGKLLDWNDLVTDQKALLAIAEKKVREEKAEMFADGFDFNEMFVFALPFAYGLTKEGLRLHYVPYEIMPYAMGTTNVIIPFEDLGDLCKICRQ